MQMTINLVLDLDTVAGRKTFAQLWQATQPTATPSIFTPPPDALPAPVPAPEPSDPIPLPPAIDQVKLNRQAAAAHARAAKTAKTAAAPGPKEQVLGPSEPSELNGAGEPDEGDEDLGLPASSMSPGEARDAGLALVRQAYAAGKVAEVKALQRAWGVAKFYDVDISKGHEFYRQAVALVQTAGLQL